MKRPVGDQWIYVYLMLLIPVAGFRYEISTCKVTRNLITGVRAWPSESGLGCVYERIYERRATLRGQSVQEGI